MAESTGNFWYGTVVDFLFQHLFSPFQRHYTILVLISYTFLPFAHKTFMNGTDPFFPSQRKPKTVRTICHDQLFKIAATRKLFFFSAYSFAILFSTRNIRYFNCIVCAPYYIRETDLSLYLHQSHIFALCFYFIISSKLTFSLP